MNKNLDVVVDVSTLTEEEYALVRKDYFGASDSSVLCGVNPFNDIEELIEQKNIKEVTEAERAIGLKPSVRKGKDLEPLILSKYTAETEIKVTKPKEMFKFKEWPILTINYDGYDEKNNRPVEAKVVTRWGEKYYDKHAAKVDAITRMGTRIEDHITAAAKKVGVPPYYYTQIQQQMLGIDATSGDIVVLFDEAWEIKIYHVPQDIYTQQYIVQQALKYQDKIKKRT